MRGWDMLFQQKHGNASQSRIKGKNVVKKHGNAFQSRIKENTGVFQMSERNVSQSRI